MAALSANSQAICPMHHRPSFDEVIGSLLAMKPSLVGRPGGTPLQGSLLPMQPSLVEGRSGDVPPFGREVAVATSCMDNSAIILSPVDDSFF